MNLNFISISNYSLQKTITNRKTEETIISSTFPPSNIECEPKFDKLNMLITKNLRTRKEIAQKITEKHVHMALSIPI